VDVAALESTICDCIAWFSPLPASRHKRVAPEIGKLGKVIATLDRLASQGDLPISTLRELNAVATNCLTRSGLASAVPCAVAARRLRPHRSDTWTGLNGI
jgi:hypothetical protein